jgi:hypothetical protein
MRAQLSENLLPNEALFETSINGRETLYEDAKTLETAEESEWTGVLRNYRRDPPLELTDDQLLDQHQSIRPFKKPNDTWQHLFSEQSVTLDFQEDSSELKFVLYQGKYMTDVKIRSINKEEELGWAKETE